MKAANYLKTSVNSYQTTRCHIPEGLYFYANRGNFTTMITASSDVETLQYCVY